MPDSSDQPGRLSEGEFMRLFVRHEPALRAFARSILPDWDAVDDARNVLKENDTVEAKVTSIERKNRRVSLSAKALEMEKEGEAIQEYARKTTTGSTTLGDKLKEQLSKTGS